jgi:hypothetical protein
MHSAAARSPNTDHAPRVSPAVRGHAAAYAYYPPLIGAAHPPAI